MVEVVVLGSGSRGNSTLVRVNGRALLIDAGFSAKELRRRLEAVGQDPRKLLAILVTHEHSDHTQALRVFTKRHPSLVAANAATLAALEPIQGRLQDCLPFVTGEPFDVGPFGVTPFLQPHDAAEPVGYVIEAEGVKIGYSTDLGHVTKLVEARLAGCAGVIFEANHDRQMLMTGPYTWPTKQRIASRQGHLSNDHAAAALPGILAYGTRKLVLAHISEQNNEPLLARTVVEGALKEAGLEHVAVNLARQDGPADPLLF